MVMDIQLAFGLRHPKSMIDSHNPSLEKRAKLCWLAFALRV